MKRITTKLLHEMLGAVETIRLPVNGFNCDVSDLWWSRLEWDEAKVPEGAMKTFADNGYLHVACRPHPDEPQDDPDFWTRQRVYCIYSKGEEFQVRDGLWVEVEDVAVDRTDGGWSWLVTLGVHARTYKLV